MLRSILRSSAIRRAASIGNRPRPFSADASPAPIQAIKGTPELWQMQNFPPERIRNFSIIAHIDHGKSTLADRLLEQLGNISTSNKNKQVLDSLSVERDRGITVKAMTASGVYRHTDGLDYLFNIIDTPGHVDFSYEISRSLSACQGVLLLVDASQGIQAQTLANFYLAFGQNLTIQPVLNKIDLPHADVPKTLKQMQDVLELDPSMAIQVSAKTGHNMLSILPGVIENIPSPAKFVSPDAPFRALLFDSWYDEYKGVICIFSVVGGSVKTGDRIISHHSKKQFDVVELGVLRPERQPTASLHAGQVGYIVCSMKNTKEANIGDTFHLANATTVIEALPGFQPSKPMIFSSFFPMDASEFDKLDSALNKLTLNDASVHLNKTKSHALGQGFRIGFLGMLHMDVFQERLEAEHGAQVIVTSPCVSYLAHRKDGTEFHIANPLEFPVNDPNIALISEPYIKSTIIMPEKYLGPIIMLCEKRRGRQTELTYMSEDRVMVGYRLPMTQVTENHFFNELKHISSGYASFDYEESGYEPAQLAKLDVMLNGELVDALSCVVHKDEAWPKARDLAKKIKSVVERQQFTVNIQIQANNKPIASDVIKAYMKNVTAKCNGGDQSRKRKLLDNQKAGKKRMRSLGRVEISHESFLSIIKR